MLLGDLCLDPTGACDIQTDIAERIRKANFDMDPAPVVAADKRTTMDSGRYIVVKVGNVGIPIDHGSKLVFQVNVIITTFTSELKLSRKDATNMINVAEKAARGPGVTQNEEYCLLQGLPIVETIMDGSFMGQVTMRATVVRPNIKC